VVITSSEFRGPSLLRYHSGMNPEPGADEFIIISSKIQCSSKPRWCRRVRYCFLKDLVLKHTKMMQKHVFLMMASSVPSDLFVPMSARDGLVQHQNRSCMPGTLDEICSEKTMVGQISCQTSYGTSRHGWAPGVNSSSRLLALLRSKGDEPRVSCPFL
jgi:hypothetical protein